MALDHLAHVRTESARFAGVLAGVRESVAPLADEKGLALELDCEGAPRQIGVDQFLVEAARIVDRFDNRVLGDLVKHHQVGVLRLGCFPKRGCEKSTSKRKSGVLDQSRPARCNDPGVTGPFR